MKKIVILVVVVTLIVAFSTFFLVYCKKSSNIQNSDKNTTEVNNAEYTESEEILLIDSGDRENSTEVTQKSAENIFTGYDASEIYNILTDGSSIVHGDLYESSNKYLEYMLLQAEDYKDVFEAYARVELSKDGKEAKFKLSGMSDKGFEYSKGSEVSISFTPSIECRIDSLIEDYILTESGDLYYLDKLEYEDDAELLAKVPVSMSYSLIPYEKKISEFNGKQCLFEDMTLGSVEERNIINKDKSEFLTEIVYYVLGDFQYDIDGELSGDIFSGLNVSKINSVVIGDNSETCQNYVGYLAYSDNNNEEKSEYFTVENVDEAQNIIFIKDSQIISSIKYEIIADDHLEYDHNRTINLKLVLKNGNEVSIHNGKNLSEFFESDESYYLVPREAMERGGKPIIYLYPEEETKISVRLKNSDKITVSYPEYNDGWDVIAKPNGNLYEIKSNKNLYALYYENINTYDFNITNSGFVIEGKDVAEFLDEKLKILGLNDKEREEFIIYWLPRLVNMKYIYVRFATQTEINENMPISIDPKPDTLIRVWMTFKEIDKPIEVREQQLKPIIAREGFTAVEWGVVEMK